MESMLATTDKTLQQFKIMECGMSVSAKQKFGTNSSL